MTTTPSTYDCVPEVAGHNNTLTRRVRMYCTTHGDRAEVRVPGDFRCTKGRNWIFLGRYTDEGPVLLLTLTELYVALHRTLTHNAYSIDDPREMVLRRWVDDDTLEPLDLSLVEGTDHWRQDDGPDGTYSYRDPEYVVTGPDGTEYLRFTVHITDY